MGAITISRTGLSGSVTIADAKITENMRLFGKATTEGFSQMTNQQKADAIAAELYAHVKRVAWIEKQNELRAARQAEDEAALNEL